ncbi:MAG: TIGR00153 family protein [Thiohalomonadaceae bacterium]
MSPKSYIFSMFGSSPIRPMQQHMAKVQACATQLIPFFEAVNAEDWAEARRIQRTIAEMEESADQLKRQLRMSLPSGLMMAMSRRDLLQVLTMQDRIANKSKDIAGLMMGRQMRFPPNMGSMMMAFVQRCIDAITQAQIAINELDELLETGFRGREVSLVESMVTKLDEIESDTDKLQVVVRDAMFALEKELHPVDVMFMYQVIDWIGDLGNLAQRVGSRLEIMLAR